ncbi:MAG: lamin tail domain-containing protein [Deltaproteobacteria bacterium]|nr:lamin tail domain-containing protein [Deltaproteobacteria bacterium]
MRRLNLSVLLVLAATGIPFGLGCEVIAKVDRDQIDDGVAGTGGAAGKGGSAGTAGTAGKGGSAGTAGTAGKGGSAGTAGTAGKGGSAGTAGKGGSAGTAGTAGTAGVGGDDGGAGDSGDDGGEGGTPCSVPEDCPATGSACLLRTCNNQLCGTTNSADDIACDDGTACTKVDTCKSGVCVGGDPVVCTASDTCHDVGTCDPQTGTCSDPVKADGATCDDGNVCTTPDTCLSAVCTGTPVAGGDCGTNGKCNAQGQCVGCNGPSDCPASTDPCKVATCSANVCGFGPASDGTVCDDNDLCTQTDTCTSGTCTGSNPKSCTALDQCHNVGVCDPSSGTCSNPSKPNNTPCNDGDLCTTVDTCESGACLGTTPVNCTALDQCHNIGVCNPTTGVCSDPAKADGVTCDDTNVCTTPDTCQAGACTGTPVAGGNCGTNGHCDANGQCVGCLNPTDCPATGDPCLVRTCVAGACGTAPATNGTACDDANPCTLTDTCQAGVCAPGTAKVCTASDQCHDAGVCNTTTGLCSNPPKVDNTGCTDGNACTLTDVCVAGSCTPGTPKVCTPSDQCHTAGTCDSGTGNCSNPVATNGTTCTDGNACTLNDTCQSGSCSPGTPKTCTASDQCHVAGTCDSGTGNCSNPNQTDGTTCNDNSLCTTGETCQAGSCTGGTVTTCTALDQCHDVGVCVPGTGVCTNPNKTDGSTCSDSNPCTTGDTCQGGACQSGTAVTCNGGTECQVNPGTCNTGTGVCDYTAAANGTSCTGFTHKPDECVSGSSRHYTNAASCQTGVCTEGYTDTVCACGCNSGTGTCQPAPSVLSTTPADGGTTSASTTIAVTFSLAMAPASLTAQTAAGACTGSIQVSLDNFASCIGFSSAAPIMSVGNTVATLRAQPGLLINRSYKVRVTTGATCSGGTPLASQYTSATGFTTTNPLTAGTSGVVISEVYGAGGNTNALWKNDYVVLHNRGTAAVSLAAMSIQYAGPTGSSWSRVNLTGSIPAGGYFLIQLNGGSNGATLPTPDLSSTSISMGASDGKIALVSNQTTLTGTCPLGSPVIDFFGYGTANCSEGGTAVSGLSITASGQRRGSGCTDTDVNSADFLVFTPAPLNSSATAFVCQPAQNESGAALEADYCTTQFPLSLTVSAGASSTVYGQIYEAGVTEAAGANSAVTAEFGYGPVTANPEYQQGWTWMAATYNVQSGNNDEYQATFTAPAAGAYRYAYRFSLDGGSSWTYCDNNQGDSGAGSNTGLTFDLVDLAPMTTN